MNSQKMSMLSALAASSCCVPPLILLGLTLLGIGSAGLAGFSSTLGAIKWYILPLAIVGVGSSYYMYFREKKKCSTAACAMANAKLTKTMLTISTVVVFGFLSWSVYPYVLGTTTIQTDDSGTSAHFAVYQVDGMTCGGCEIAVNGAAAATGLVDSVKSSFTESRAYVWYNDDNKLAQIEQAIKQVGYDPKLLEKK